MLTLLCLLSFCGCGPSSSSSVDPGLKRFAEAKRASARALVIQQKLTMPRGAWGFFDATIEGQWQAASNTYATLPGLARPGASAGKQKWRQAVEDKIFFLLSKVGYKRKPATGLQAGVRTTLIETYGALEQFTSWDNRLLHLYGDMIIASIPTNSIYFGGTDSGRYIVSALSESQIEGRPFFTLAQNALVDGTYLAYVRDIYGKRLSLPSADDSQQAFGAYVADAQARLDAGKLKPGESVVRSEGRVTISGRTAVMEVNALLARAIFEKNPDRELYVEESWPLDWMYPYLTPHGPVLKLNRQALIELSEALVLQDRQYWQSLGTRLIGDTVTYTSSLAAVCDFVRRVYVKKDLAGFRGDPQYVRDGPAQTGFSALRSAIGGVYAWRAGQAGSPEERERMLREAEFAYRQALALGPGNSEAVGRYAELLISLNRTAEATTLLETSLAAAPGSPNLSVLLKSLQ